MKLINVNSISVNLKDIDMDDVNIKKFSDVSIAKNPKTNEYIFSVNTDLFIWFNDFQDLQNFCLGVNNAYEKIISKDVA